MTSTEKGLVRAPHLVVFFSPAWWVLLDGEYVHTVAKMFRRSGLRLGLDFDTSQGIIFVVIANVIANVGVRVSWSSSPFLVLRRQFGKSVQDG